MVLIELVNASNEAIPTSLPTGLVAVFAGGTSGIGEATLRLFAKLAVNPRVYIIGRSRSAAENIIADCRQSNPGGEFVFIQKDLDLLKNTNEAVKEIKAKEKKINILFLSAGGPDMTRTVTSEGLHKLYALHIYGRLLFIIKLLPLLRAGSSELARVISVASGAHEGIIDTNDFPALKQSLSTLRGHGSSIMTLAIDHLAKESPEVSFINDYPGLVITKSLDSIGGVLGIIIRTTAWLFARWLAVTLAESAERHLFLVTSEAFQPKEGTGKGVPLVEGLELHQGIDGKAGTGVYSVTWDCEGPGDKAIALLAGYRTDGMQEKVWSHVIGEIERVERENA